MVARFAPAVMHEQASHCLLSLLLAFHGTVPLAWVRMRAGLTALGPVQVDPTLDNPYPGLWRQLPFAYRIEDSEDKTRTLQLRFVEPIDDAQAQECMYELLTWSAGVSSGAFGAAPTPPEDCDFAPVNEIEHVDEELSWTLYSCRFHWAALESLVQLCATLHHTQAPLAEVVIE